MSKLAKIFMENVQHYLKGRSNYWLGNESGLSQSTISRFMNGETNVTIDSIEMIAKALKVHPSDLLEPKSSPKKSKVPQDILDDLEGQPEVVYESIRTMLKAISAKKR